MKKILLSILTAFVFAGAVFYFQNANSEISKLDLGVTAPDFALNNSKGELVKLADYAGKTIVLEWTNPECPFVKRHYEVKTMQKLADANPDVVWLAINSTHFFNSDKNAEWKTKEGFPYQVLDDHTGVIGKSYGATSTPHMFVIDAKGKLQYQGAIDNDAYGDKSESEILNYVQQALTELSRDKPVSIPSTEAYGCSVKYAS